MFCKQTVSVLGLTSPSTHYVILETYLSSQSLALVLARESLWKVQLGTSTTTDEHSNVKK